MESLWNSPYKVDMIRFVAQWVAAIAAIIALIFGMRFSTLKNKEQEELNERMAQAEKAAILHQLPKRLRALLESIDPKIIPTLKAGNTKFSGNITAMQFNDLQKISREPGASKYLTISSNVKMGVGRGPEGVHAA